MPPESWNFDENTEIWSQISRESWNIYENTEIFNHITRESWNFHENTEIYSHIHENFDEDTEIWSQMPRESWISTKIPRFLTRLYVNPDENTEFWTQNIYYLRGSAECPFPISNWCRRIVWVSISPHLSLLIWMEFFVDPYWAIAATLSVHPNLWLWYSTLLTGVESGYRFIILINYYRFFKTNFITLVSLKFKTIQKRWRISTLIVLSV